MMCQHWWRKKPKVHVCVKIFLWKRTTSLHVYKQMHYLMRKFSLTCCGEVPDLWFFHGSVLFSLLHNPPLFPNLPINLNVYSIWTSVWTNDWARGSFPPKHLHTRRFCTDFLMEDPNLISQSKIISLHLLPISIKWRCSNKTLNWR